MLYIWGATRTILLAVFEVSQSVSARACFSIFVVALGGSFTAAAMRVNVELLEVAVPESGEIPDLAPFG
jgi:hypothetical protein